MPTASAVDAVVVGAGHNGLVAANLLADAGWQVLVLEAAGHPGGAVHSDESVHAGYISDLYSSFYPLGAASPILRALKLEQHGLRWTHAPTVLAHVWPDDRSAAIWRDRELTAASVEDFAAGDGQAWLDLVNQFDRICEPLLDSLFTPFPPVRAATRLARRMGTAELLRFTRFALTPVRRFGEEQFRGPAGPLLIAGNALHTDTNWLANVTGRIGYAIFDRNLLYVKGGGAWIDQSNSVTAAGTVFNTGDYTRSGWTVGAGWEYAFAPNWSAKIEYNYMDFGSKSPTFISAGGAAVTNVNVDQTAHLALFGINYKFGGNPVGPWR